MSQILPQALTETIENLGKLPGVGSRTAERYAYYLLKNNATISENLVFFWLFYKLHSAPN